MTIKTKLIQLLKEKSIRIGEFTLASGATSNFYIDARQTTLHATGAHLIAQLVFENLEEGVVGIGGPVTGADPIVGAVALYSQLQNKPIHGFMVRKQPKGHGAKHWVEGLGNLPKGSKVCVVEDTVTTGGSLLKAIQKIEDVGLVVQQCMALVDREEGAAEKVRAAGYPFQALIGKRELL
jgi:orotate phosphoribosyltransferase